MSMSSPENSATTRASPPPKPLGIFWDIDNCPIPLTASASGVVKQIREFVAERHPECSYAKEFIVTTDTRHMADPIADNLINNGIVISHVNASAKNAADDKLQEHIETFIDNFAEKSPVLVIITGDINFAKTMRTARKKNIVVVLIFSDLCSQDLKNCANESYSFTDIIEGLEEVVNSSVEPKTTFLKVCNLPKERPVKEVLRVLSRHLANCGGKPVNYSDGSALVQFGTQEDAIRAHNRFKVITIFGKPCLLYLISEGLNNCHRLQEFNICKSVIRGLPFQSAPNIMDLVVRKVDNWKDPEVNGQLIAKVEAFDDVLVVTAVTPGANQKLLNSAHLYQSPESVVQWTEAKDYESIGAQSRGWCAKSPAEQVSDDRRSVIKGLTTEVDQNVTQVIKDLVDNWNDSQLSGSLIVSVERNTKQTDTELEGKCNLFVTAVSADASRALVKGAKSHITDAEVKWTPYKHKFQTSEECKSVIKGLDIRGVTNITAYVRNVVNKWSDPRIRGHFILSVERNTSQNRNSSVEEKCNLFVTATTPQTSRALIKGAKHYLKPEHNVRWLPYEPKLIFRNRFGSTNGGFTSDSDESQCSFYSTTSSVSVATNASKATNNGHQSHRQTHRVRNGDNIVDNNRMSIITGLPTRKEDNVLKIVRKLVSGWKEKRINGNLIEKVERDPIFGRIDAKIPLFVTALNPECSKALVSAAQKCLPSNSGIKWQEFHSNQPKGPKPVANRMPVNLNRPPLLPYPPFPPNYNPVLPYWLHFPGFQPHINQALFMPPLLPSVNPLMPRVVRPSAQNNNQLKSETLAKTQQNSPKDSKDSAHASQPIPLTVEQLLASATQKSVSNESQPSLEPPMASKEDSNKTGTKPKTTNVSNGSTSANQRLSLITGLKIEPNEDVTRAVRRMIMDWRDSSCNGNFIVAVERGADTHSGLSVYKIWTKNSSQTDALLEGARRHLRPDSGTIWTHSQPRIEPKTKAPTARRRDKHPNNMFVIIGQKSRHNEDVLLLVRALVVHLFDCRVRVEDVVDVTRDYRFKGDGRAMLFVTVVESEVKDLILELAKSLEPRTDLQFKDYNGFKH